MGRKAETRETEFKPPWVYFPLRTFCIDGHRAVLEVGFDQNNNMTYGTGYIAKGENFISSWTFCGENLTDAQAEFIEMISFAKWCAKHQDEG